MKNNFRILFAIASLALAALACQALSGAPTSTQVPDVAPADTSVPDVNDPPSPIQSEEPASNSDVLLDDDFSAGRTQWGTGTDADSGVEYVDEALNFKIFTKNYIVWTTPNDNDYENVHMEVTAFNHSTNSAGAFGIICNMQLTNTSYYFAITGAGEYAIGLYTFAGDTLLTNDGEWGKSSLIKSGADSYRIGADCGGGVLTLYVDGQRIDSATDTTYTSGKAALFAWSGKEPNGTHIFFDDFVMTKLK